MIILALLAMPLAAQAQQGRVYRVGVVLLGGPFAQAIDGLRDGLKELGFEEGNHFALLVRDGRGDVKAVEAAAAGLERDGVDVIYAIGSAATLAVKRATKTVLVVFHSGGDPVGLGVAENFRKPGGRFTGVSSQSRDLAAKRLELLKEMIPTVRRVVSFLNPETSTEVIE